MLSKIGKEQMYKAIEVLYEYAIDNPNNDKEDKESIEEYHNLLLWLQGIKELQKEEPKIHNRHEYEEYMADDEYDNRKLLDVDMENEMKIR